MCFLKLEKLIKIKPRCSLTRSRIHLVRKFGKCNEKIKYFPILIKTFSLEAREPYNNSLWYSWTRSRIHVVLKFRDFPVNHSHVSRWCSIIDVRQGNNFIMKHTHVYLFSIRGLCCSKPKVSYKKTAHISPDHSKELTLSKISKAYNKINLFIAEQISL